MSLPGLDLSSEPTEQTPAPIVQDLREQSEWRFEVAFGTKVEVKLLSGSAELFGTELTPQQPYSFTGTKAAIYTWYGCQLEVVGECQVEYVAEETPMTSYANLHFALERLRDKVITFSKEGPRVLVVGPDNAGKTSLVKLLTAYATRSSRQPVVVNLDTKEGLLSIPGSLSATVFSSLIDLEEGWGSSPTNGPMPVPVKLPLVYYLGIANPEDKTPVYKSIISRLALSVLSKLQENVEIKSAGCIIDTPGIISQGRGGYEVIQHVVSEFAVNLVVVLGSERLYSDMMRRFNGQKTSAGETMSVIKLDKSGGCVDRDEAYLQRFRQSQVREYFFGDAKSALSPHTQLIDFDQVHVFRLNESPSALLVSLLPGDATEDDAAPATFDKLQPSTQMQNAILAIIQAEPNDTQEAIRDASVVGFVHVVEVDEKRKKLKLLAPLSERLPSKAMIWGGWPEGMIDVSA